jgi:predicted alpha/beta hydrolase
MAGHLIREIDTGNGQRLTARLFMPEQPPKAAVLMVPAMGVTQTFYAPLAEWLAAEGYLAATFDYRGIGQSRHGPLQELHTNILEWGRLDCGAMLDALGREAPGAPIYWIGHSLGGQIIPFVPDHGRLTKAVTVATGSGYWRENAAPLRWQAWWLWYVVAPLATATIGYFPGRRLRKVGDLPRGVMDQWRRWCLDPEYAVGAEGAGVRAQYAAVRSPVVSLSFTDDEFMSARNTASLHGFYTGAPQVRKRISPADIGVRSIGHFGFFRPRFAESLWRQHLLPELVSAPR